MKSVTLALGSALLLMSAAAQAQFEVNGGLTYVSPQSVSSSQLSLNGSALPSRVSNINGNTGLFLGGAYNFNEEVSVNLGYLSGLKHRVSESGLGIGNVGRFDLDVWTLNGKYRLLPRSEVNPYLQAGLIHIRPGSERASAGLRAGLGTNNISMQVDSATGWSLGAGLDVWLSDSMGAFGEISYNRVKTDAAYNVAGSDLRARSIDADPLIYRAGLMFRF